MTIHFDKEHNNPDDCQLIVCITGNREHVISELKRMLKEAAHNGKPIQGTLLHAPGTTTVITPIWNGIPR